VAYLRILFREQHLLKEFQETDSKTKNSWIQSCLMQHLVLPRPTGQNSILLTCRI
jgi:hypothetical protein